MYTNRLFLIMTVAFCGLCSACPSAGIHRSARILERGQSELTATSNVGFTSLRASSSESSSLVLPGVVPVLSYHVGVAENVEVGANVSPLTLSMSLDAKYRLLKSDDGKFHLALQPSVDLQALVVAYAFGGSLPLIATYEFNDMFAVTAYGYGKASHQRPITDIDSLIQTNVGGGLGAGVEVRGDSFFFMPFVEASSTMSLSQDASAPSTQADVLQFGISVGYHGDLLRLIDKKIDRIESKVDRVETRLDNMDSKLDQIIDGHQASSAPTSDTSAQSKPSTAQ